MLSLLKFLGVSEPASVKVTDLSIAFHGLNPGYALLIAVVIIGATAWVYLTTTARLAAWKKWLLIVLRSLLLAMILLMLMRPVLLLTVEGTIRRSLLLLIDSREIFIL